MPERLRKPRVDVNELAARIVGIATGEISAEPESDKNPAAVALGRLGGLKGGVARAKALTQKKRREIAQKAAKVRWGKKSKT